MMSNKRGEPKRWMKVPQGDFELFRYPETQDFSLRAWDAADEYILQYIAKNFSKDLGRVLILNDAFGALVSAIPAVKILSLSDSFIAHKAQRLNLDKRAISDREIQFLPSTVEIKDLEIHFVFIKLPKNLSFLEDQLQHLSAQITPKTIIVGAAMNKYLHRSTIALFEKYIGPTTTSLAKKKARLLFSKPEKNRFSSTQFTWPKKIKSTEEGPIMVNYSNIFSREKLDIGTRFFVENLPTSQHNIRVLDLGCGNGILGTVVKLENPNATLVFIDESYMAIASARATYELNIKKNIKKKDAEFRVGNGVSDLQEPGSIGDFDLILCNPPFHNQHEIGTEIATRMFIDAHNALSSEGQFWVIGNTHLAHHLKLKKYFHKVELKAKNKKFAIYCATKAKRR